jgi:hypothetical protein
MRMVTSKQGAKESQESKTRCGLLLVFCCHCVREWQNAKEDDEKGEVKSFVAEPKDEL